MCTRVMKSATPASVLGIGGVKPARCYILTLPTSHVRLAPLVHVLRAWLDFSPCAIVVTLGVLGDFSPALTRVHPARKRHDAELAFRKRKA